MRAWSCLVWAATVLAGAATAAELAGSPLRMELVRPSQYAGMADASGAVAVSSNLFLVANDEDNRLRLYRTDAPGAPVREYNMDAFLGVRGKSREADLEAGARIGDRAFWIGSHGRNRNGKERSNRCCFFATDITMQGGAVTLTPVGIPYRALLEDLGADARLEAFHLTQASLLAPKEEGALDIEGLGATPEAQLLIGFRNPIPEGKALLVPLQNPNEVVLGRRARLGPPTLLDLGGLGIRDLVCWNGTYLILAGSHQGGGEFHLYRWAGGTAEPERVKVSHLNGYNPEAIVLYPHLGWREIQLLSDDGALPVDGVPGKESTAPESHRSFRSFWLVQ